MNFLQEGANNLSEITHNFFREYFLFLGTIRFFYGIANDVSYQFMSDMIALCFPFWELFSSLFSLCLQIILTIMQFYML